MHLTLLSASQTHVASLGVILSWTCSLLVAVSFLPALQVRGGGRQVARQGRG